MRMSRFGLTMGCIPGVLLAIAVLTGCSSNLPTTIQAVDANTHEIIGPFKLSRTQLIWRHPNVDWTARSEPEQWHSRDNAVVVPKSNRDETFLLTSNSHAQAIFQIDGSVAYIISDPRIIERFEADGFTKADADQREIGPDRLLQVPVRPRP